MACGREVKTALFWATTNTLVLSVLIWLGSRSLANFDAALVGYTFACLFSVFGITYRYTMWTQRPPTKMYWRRGWAVFFRPNHLANNLKVWVQKVAGDFALNGFIKKRNKRRWLTHFLIMWGCIIAAAITFPLVFGWIHFETAEGALDWYRVFVFGLPIFSFPIHSSIAFVLFHGLVWSAFLTIAGVMLAMHRRMAEHGAASVQQFAIDMAPLLMLFAVSITGLMLTASYTWMKGRGYEFLAILHAITVIATLIYLPFGKFFHIFQRPAQLGVSFYQEVGRREGSAKCARCDEEYAPSIQIEDLKTIEDQLGYSYQMEGPVEHYQHICPKCRRCNLALAQGSCWWESGLALPQPRQSIKPIEEA